MDSSQWVQEVADARIARQLETADAIDAKGGVLFAYCGALIVAAPSLAGSNGLPHAVLQMWGTLALAFLAIVATVVLLWPQVYDDPPDAKKLEANVRGQSTARVRQVLEALIDQQLAAIDKNERLMGRKAVALKVAVMSAGLGTATLAWEVAAVRGVV